jgi:hypothetical protein
MGGLMVATVLTLLVVPALYALWFRVRRDEPLEALAQPIYPLGRAASPLPIAAE